MNEPMEIAVSGNDKMPQMDMSFGPGKGYDAIHELMRAIILRAVEDYRAGGELRELAVRYFFDQVDEDVPYNEEDEYIFAFSAICKHLGLDPEKTRYAIMNAKHRISTRRRAA